MNKKDNKKTNLKPSKVKVFFKLILKLVILFFIVSIFSVLFLKWVTPITSSIMIQKQIGSIFQGKFKHVKYEWVNYDKVSKFLPLAFVASEDQNFPNHFGFDFGQIQKAFKENKRRRRIRGASTITQQVAKNLFLWNGKSFIRKGFEAYFTLLIEIFWSKERILEVYINIAQLGENIFGVKEASQIYFNKPPKRLTILNSALLAAVLPNPIRYSVKHPSNYIINRQDWIIIQMGLLGGTSYLKHL